MDINISLAPEILFHIGSFPVSNSLLWSVVISFAIIAVTLSIRVSAKQVPGKLQGLFEVMLDYAFEFVKSVIGSDKKAKKVFPLIFTLFIFILTANLVTFIPGQSAITLKTSEGVVPLFRAAMADYSLVFLLTIMVVFLVQIIAIITHGPFGYIGRFINISGFKDFFVLLMKGKVKFGVLAQGFLDFFLGIMDIIGEIAKIVSLSFRLFGNIFAGEVLTTVMLFLAPFIVPLPFMFLGLLTAVVQAFVFSVLTLIFITMASEIDEKSLPEEKYT